MRESYTCTSCATPAVPAAHLPKWDCLLAGADGLKDHRLRDSTADTYCSSLRDYCSFSTTHGATSVPATLDPLRDYINPKP